MADSLRQGSRREIIWIGTPIRRVVTALKRRQLTVRCLDLGRTTAEPKTATRAVVVPISEGLRETLARLFLPVLDSGAALFVVLPSKENAKSDLELANYAIGTVKRFGKEEADEVRQLIMVLPAWQPDDFAERCASHDPGRPENLDLKLSTPEKIDQSHRRLLSRAFHDFDMIRLTRLSGGFSDSKVWKVEAFRAGGHSCEPFVVKAGKWRKIVTEIGGMKDLVEAYVPFAYYAPLVSDRSVEGATDALMVSMFVDRALSMNEYLGKGAARLVIAALFDGALRRWRTNRQAARLELGDVYRRLRVIPSLEDSEEQLSDAYQVAAALRTGTRRPMDLVGALLKLPLMDVDLVYAHGDLNPKNMFVKQNSTDVVLIDFALAGQKSPLSRDPARLDVALAFDKIDGLDSLNDTLLREIYTARLFPPSPKLLSIDNRTEAIHQVRVQAMGEGVAAREYEVSVACYLLKICGFPDLGQRRGLAYDLADLLVGAI